MAVAIERGKKRTVASALEWPGWTRIGRDDDDALQALVDYAPRYAGAIRQAKLKAPRPASPADLTVVEDIAGNATTDYGVPGMAPARDGDALDAVELRRLEAILSASWQALERTAASAAGRPLRKGPRGGGRELEKIIEHVVDAHAAYLSTLGHQADPRGEQPGLDYIAALRAATHEGLALAIDGRLPAVGPRGGKRWSPRYFVRRAAWHILDHAWEIEDRIE